MNVINLGNHYWVLMASSAICRWKSNDRVVGEVKINGDKGFQVRGDFQLVDLTMGVYYLRDYGRIIHTDSAYQLVGLFQRLENADYHLVNIQTQYGEDMALQVAVTFCGYAKFHKLHPEIAVERIHDYGLPGDDTPDNTEVIPPVHSGSGDRSPRLAHTASGKGGGR